MAGGPVHKQPMRELKSGVPGPHHGNVLCDSQPQSFGHRRGAIQRGLALAKARDMLFCRKGCEALILSLLVQFRLVLFVVCRLC